MLRFTSIVLVFAMTFGFITKTVLILNYNLYKKSYAEMFCVNKSKPELECNGKCHLSKTIAVEQQQESSPKPRPSFVEDLELSFCTITNKIDIEPIDNKLFNHYSNYSCKELEGCLIDIFQPPRIA